MNRVIAVANQKGGCGKTTTSINLAASLAFLGKRVLLIDLDPQAHSSIGMGINPEDLEKSLFDVFDDSAGADLGLNEVLVKAYRNLDLAPAQVILSAMEQTLSGKEGREKKLADKIKSLRSAYDFIIIDCPPSLGLLTFNALSAADEVIVPVEPSFFALHGLKKLLETVNLVEEITLRKIDVNAVITIFDKRTKYAREVVGDIQKFFGDNTFGVIIRRNVKLQEATQKGKPITKFDKDTPGFEDYMNLAVEVIERCSGLTVKMEQVSSKSVEKDKEEEFFQRDEVAEPLVDSFEDNVEISTNKEDIADYMVFNATSGNSSTALLEEIVVKPKVFHKVDCSPKISVGGILFSIQALPCDNVEIAGDFNNWQPERMITPCDNENVWTVLLPLPCGTYKYKFLINGRWTVDPDNPHRQINSFGDEDSVIVVE